MPEQTDRLFERSRESHNSFEINNSNQVSKAGAHPAVI